MRHGRRPVEPTHQEAHIHHAHWFGSTRATSEDNYFRGNAEWVFGNGDEETRADFRRAQRGRAERPGLRPVLQRGQPQPVIYMLHNKTAQPITVYIVLDVIFIHGTPRSSSTMTGGRTTTSRACSSAAPTTCRARPNGDGMYEYATRQGRKTSAAARQAARAAARRVDRAVDGTIVGMGGHLHPGGLG